ncbi:hypothetical protein KKB40_01395 [Patescibacteria group bacterium]|nr:hypothetical protein [Patescibacteria group bacterium]
MSTDIPLKDGFMNTHDAILKLLNVNKVEYNYYKHEPVYTSKQAVKVRGDTKLHQGAKALVLQADREFILLVLPADLRADLDFLKNWLNVNKLRMASKDSVKAKTGLEVGSIPPFGSVLGLKTYLDSRMADNDEIAFNAGRHDRSVKMKYVDYVKLEKPTLIHFN